MLDLIPCADSPNCEIKVVRFPVRFRHLRSTEIYCPDCKTVPMRRRKTRLEKIRKDRLRAEARNANALESQANGATEDSNDVPVEQQAESSTIAENRGTDADNLFLNFANFDNLLPTIAEFEAFFSIPPIAPPSRPNVGPLVSDSDDPFWNTQDAEAYEQEMQAMGFFPTPRDSTAPPSRPSVDPLVSDSDDPAWSTQDAEASEQEMQAMGFLPTPPDSSDETEE